MKHLPLKFVGGLTAAVAMVTAAYYGGEGHAGGQDSFAEGALQARPGDMPQYHLKPEWAETGAACRVPLEHPGQLLVNITDRLGAKPDGTPVTEDLLVRVIREEMQC